MNIHSIQLLLFPSNLYFFVKILTMIYFLLWIFIIIIIILSSIKSKIPFLYFLLKLLLYQFKKYYAVKIMQSVGKVNRIEIIVYASQIILAGYISFLISEYLLYLFSAILSLGISSFQSDIYNGLCLLPLALTFMSMAIVNKYFAPQEMRKSVIKILIEYLLLLFYFQIELTRDGNVFALQKRILAQTNLIERYTRCINIRYRKDILHAIDNMTISHDNILIIQEELDDFLLLLIKIYDLL